MSYIDAINFAYALNGEKSPYMKYDNGQNDARIENTFTYHPPKDDQPQRYEALREKAKELAYLINGCCPESREKSLAFTYLEMTIFEANASIARNE